MSCWPCGSTWPTRRAARCSRRCSKLSQFAAGCGARRTTVRRVTRVEPARRFADCLRLGHPAARYELDWSMPFGLRVATVLAGGSKDSAVNAVSPAVFACFPTAQALAAAIPWPRAWQR
jgi:hypothetical protein